MDQMDTYFRPDLARVHEDAFGFHADNCASGILDLFAPVLERDGLVLEIGCGTGLLTRHLVGAGHRVVATDASEAMLAIARDTVPAAEVRRLTLPDDPLPAADAIVGVGHVLNYLGDESAVLRALAGLAAALRPGGVLAIDLCDLAWATARRNAPARGRVTRDWAMITSSSCRGRTDSPSSWPSSPATTTGHGAGTTNDTTSSYSTRPACRRCCADWASTPPSATPSAPNGHRPD